MIEVWKDIIGYEGLYQVSDPRKSGELSRVCDYENKTAGGYHWQRV